VTKLVYLESGDDINVAIAREKQSRQAQGRRKLR
jgi:hypothetical protein